ncbi:MAG: 2Fe-2S iron-sulfur cluster binding domain-containing protein [Kordiimonadaceae bacterium]|nr:2Fe-2S iron-sulfur cluster binding domain-containing protein [Kordiimonadaceae bacterium]MBO6570157.1 2Fe-2S iron-sulfur cluster binding domain-containing protein [Kordiimonadaceae bacterium]MBO6965745.1 2Fe-2S iron-sulfur cluster binding domain-containing protein [Kordiimonadaceae bacterium]
MSTVTVTFVLHDGEEIEASGAAGSTVLELAQSAGVEIEGACEGNMACSTCHVVVDETSFSSLPEPTEDEEEMLDLATGLKRTSRLGCQIEVSPAVDGMRLEVPRESRNMMGL